MPIFARKKPQAMPAAFKNSECMRNLHKQTNLAYARKIEQLYPYLSAEFRPDWETRCFHPVFDGLPELFSSFLPSL